MGAVSILPTNKHTTPRGGSFPNHFPYFLMQESTHEWGGGGVEGLGKGERGGGPWLGGGIFHWGGGVVLHQKEGWGRWVYGLGNGGP